MKNVALQLRKRESQGQKVNSIVLVGQEVIRYKADRSGFLLESVGVLHFGMLIGKI